MKSIIKLFLLCIVLSTSAMAHYENDYTYDAVTKDFNEQNTVKYKQDDLQTLSLQTLKEKGIFAKDQSDIRDYQGEGYLFKDIINAGGCEDVDNNYTATVYSLNLRAGVVTCIVAKKNDLYNSIGLFNLYYPKIKTHFRPDRLTAATVEASSISEAEASFKPLYTKKAEIAASTKSDGNYLNITQLMLASILTDTDIIDVEATKAAGNLRLKGDYTSKHISDSSKNTMFDNGKYILVDDATLFNIYSGLGNVSMSYLILLVVFFGVFGIGRAVLSPMADKIEKKQTHDKHVPYGVGLLAGVLLFFPTNDHQSIKNTNGDTVSSYEIMKTRYQKFEKTGYYLFAQWADDASSVIIDSEMNAIIDKSGIGTKDQIIDTYANKVMYENLSNFYKDYSFDCSNNVYDFSQLTTTKGRSLYSETENSIFPLSESWAYASFLKYGLYDFYYTSPRGIVKDWGYSDTIQKKVQQTNEGIYNYYPKMSFSSCGRAYYKMQDYSDQAKQYAAELDKLTANSKADNLKLDMIEKLIEFQYGLKRDYGFLAILGLPVTKMQTEYIGGLYQTKNSEVIDKLNETVTKDSAGMHMILSTIPYLFLPGAGTVYQVTVDNSGKIGATLGGLAGGASGGGAFSWLTAPIGAALGGAAGFASGSAIGMLMAYQVSKTMLALTPIIGIVIIGLMRFVLIIIKIFIFHFTSLFVMPLMFARNNLSAISTFSIKIISTMLELPLFVLSVWLAITANSLVHSLGDVFSKKIIIGMLDNVSSQYSTVKLVGQSTINGQWLAKIKIYLFDGFMEVAISVFAIIIIYKLLITTHSMVFEMIEMKGAQTLDNSIDSMKNEASGWGTRI